MSQAKGVYILLMVLGIGSYTYGQKYSFQQFTVNEGLPSNETYCAIQDDQGDLLIGTDNGVARFDGQGFSRVEFENKQLNNAVIFEMFRDRQNRVWAKSYRHGLFLLENGRFTAFEHNKKILQVIGNSYIDQIRVDKNSRFWFTVAGAWETLYRLDMKGNLEVLQPDSVRAKTIRWIAVPEGAESLQVITDYSPGKPGNARAKKDCQLIPGENEFLVLTCSHDIPNARTTKKAGCMISEGDYTFLNIHRQLLVFDRNGQLQEEKLFEGQILNLQKDHSGNLLIATRNGAYIRYRNNGEYVSLLQKETINWIYQDHEGGYWFTSIHSGIFYLPDPNLFSLPYHWEPGDILMAIAGNEKFLLIANHTQNSIHVLKKNGDRLEPQRNFPVRLQPYITDNLHIYGDTLFIGLSYFRLSTGKEYPFLPSQIGEYIRRFFVNDSLFGMVYEGGFRVYNHRSATMLSDVLSDSIMFTCIIQSGDRYLTGSDKGVFEYRPETGLRQLFRDTLNQMVRDIREIGNGQILVSTWGQGIFILEENKLVHLGKQSGLTSMYCGKTVIEKNGVIWIATDNGLNRLEYSGEGKYGLSYLTTSDGLASNYIQNLCTSGNLLVIQTTNGINYLNLSRYRAKKHRLTRISVQVNGNPAFPDSVIRIGPGIRDLSLGALASGLRKPDGMAYSFLLEGEDIRLFQQTASGITSFHDIPPGLYRLKVDAEALNHSLLPGETFYTLRIEAFFFEQTWFKVGMIVLVILILLVSTWYFFYRREQQRKARHQYHELQMEALSLQISPHFLFNSLNSIQYLALKDDYRTLNRFVSRLSSLLRRILNNSLIHSISLKEELENTGRYLEMEQFRFGKEAFEYEVDISGTAPAPEKEKVPPFILQPLVENAIWHGVLPKEQGGKIRITVRSVEGGFCVLIEDNGVGLSATSSSKKKEAGQSFGLKNVERRVELYRKMNLGKAYIEFGIPDDFGGAGTRVQLIFLPKRNKT